MENNHRLKESLEDPDHLPLQAFHLVVVVEPDQETWMSIPEDDDQKETIWGMHLDMIETELSEDIHRNLDSSAEDFGRPKFMWLSWMLQGPGLYGEELLETAEYMFRLNEDPENETAEGFNMFLESLKDHHPGWQIAIIGGMYEEEVKQIAEKFCNYGFDTTILMRYCLSSRGFHDLDRLLEESDK